jgi:cob(I)alamin adenosyltransferase
MGLLSKETLLRQPLYAGAPLVERVRLAFLVPGAVRELQKAAAPRLVEPASPLVLLEDPKLEAAGPASLRMFEQCAADASPLRLRLDVEVLQRLVSKCRESKHAAVLLPEPDFPLANLPREELQILLGRMQRREKRESAEGASIQRRDRRPVLRDRSPDHVRNLESMRKREEPVRLTRIYTRGGDRGETSLGDGSRVSKLDCRIGAFGTVDELNAQLGLLLAGDLPAKHRDVLVRIQNELFDVGADLSVPYGVGDGRLRIVQERIDSLERLCDEFNAELPELKSFVLPGGTEAAARLHVARTICRRAERDAIAATQEVEVNPLALVYLNRLSDLLFILARAANAEAGADEPLWRPGKFE